MAEQLELSNGLGEVAKNKGIPGVVEISQVEEVSCNSMEVVVRVRVVVETYSSKVEEGI